MKNSKTQWGVFILLGICFFLNGCNTCEGVGKLIQGIGADIEITATGTKNELKKD